MDPDIENLLTAENEHIIKLQEIVKKTIEDENLIIQNLLNPPKEIVTRGQNISDKVARFGGSWFFIISFLRKRSRAADAKNYHKVGLTPSELEDRATQR